MAGLALLLLAGVAFGYLPLPLIDPADHFEVVSVLSDPMAHRHAIVYRYYHANSSTTATAVWITSDPPPKVGSEEPPRGSPVLVWPGAAESLSLNWGEDHSRLSVRVSGPVRVSEDVNQCYFEYDRATSRVCVDMGQAEIVTN